MNLTEVLLLPLIFTMVIFSTIAIIGTVHDFFVDKELEKSTCSYNIVDEKDKEGRKIRRVYFPNELPRPVEAPIIKEIASTPLPQHKGDTKLAEPIKDEDHHKIKRKVNWQS